MGLGAGGWDCNSSARPSEQLRCICGEVQFWYGAHACGPRAPNKYGYILVPSKLERWREPRATCAGS